MAGELYIGVMSGTSLDGVDLALAECSADAFCLKATHFVPMPDDLRQALAVLCARGETSLHDLGVLDHRLGLLYADAIIAFLRAEKLSPERVCAIGCHGQTVWHAPGGTHPFTMQLGDANIVAARTGIATVADFRRKDMAFGGQGAPLTPAFHQAIFAREDLNVVVLNVGGISNISLLIPGEPVLGYDTGPGNVLLDLWVERHLGKRYDHDAAWARSGKTDPLLLSHLLDDAYFFRPVPKSTGRERFNLAWLEKKLADFPGVSPADVQATLLELTAESISAALRCRLAEASRPCRLLVCGGGAKNPLLMARLRALLPSWLVGATQDQGMDADYVEAAAFAWLAHQRMHNLPGNVPEVTGAHCAAVLGAAYPAERPGQTKKTDAAACPG